MRRNDIQQIGSVSIGDRFLCRTSEMFGESLGHDLPFEAQTLIVVGIKPRYVNQVVVQSASGHEFLMPLRAVEKGIEAAESAPEGLQIRK